MTLLNRLRAMLTWIFRRSRAEKEMDAELREFVEMAAAEKIRDGVAPSEARRLAMIEVGGLEQTKEEIRANRHGHLIDEVALDLRYALRMFARNPGFTAAILITLALGIGANTAIFSLIDALMLRSLPVTRPQELVQVNLGKRDEIAGESFSAAIVKGLDQQREIFRGVTGFSSSTFNLGTATAPVRVNGALVTGSYYRTLGLEPVIGRLLVPDDDQVGAPLTAVLSYGYWERQYAKSNAVVGQTIRMNNATVEIVGVSPKGFVGTDASVVADITCAVSTLPQLYPSLSSLLGPGTFWLRVLARPAVGLSASAAEARLNAAWPGFADSVIAPHWDATRRKGMAESVFSFHPGATGWSSLRETYQQPLYILMAVAGVVLLIACANVASLFLLRATARQREIAVRLAIGAGRRRIVRQLVIEGLVLSFAGAAIGIGVAWVSGRFLVDLISTSSNTIEFDLTPNAHILWFSASVATLTGVVFGLIPAIRTRGTSPQLVIKDNSRTSTRRSVLLPSLVTVQVALSLVLVAGAGLFVRTLVNLKQQNAGFGMNGVFVTRINRGTASTESRIDESVLEDVRRIPGVITAGLATHTPLDGSSWTEAVAAAGRPVPQTDNTRMIAAGPAYFDALQIPMARGRAFSETDLTNGSSVAVLSERAAAREFPNEDAIGRHITARLAGKDVDFEVVGVVRDVKFGDLRTQTGPTMYVPYGPYGRGLGATIAMRTSGPQAEMREAIRATLQPRLPASPVDVRALATQVSTTLVRERMMATLASGFGVLALLLASVGLYGLLAYGVAQRSREIGIRMALGARSSSVVSLILLNGARLVAVGLLIGYPAAWAASRSVESLLFGLKPADPVTLTAAAALLVTAAAVASYLPARRASRVNPVEVLRGE